MPKWIRVKDPETGHEFDVAPNNVLLKNGKVEELEDYPPNEGTNARPRATKYRVDKAGQPLSSDADTGETETDTPVGLSTDVTEENADGAA